MTITAILIALLLALVVGWVAYLLASLVDFARPHATTIGMIVAIVVFISQLGWL